MKADTFTAPGLLVVRQWDRWNGALFIAWKPSVSMAFRERKALLKFVAWPIKTPTGDRFREWLNSFEPQAPEPAAATKSPELSPELLATGFGPECHLDESDPNYQTRTVI
jgi:hypothetical protein